jgi:hypothetical protein
MPAVHQLRFAGGLAAVLPTRIVKWPRPPDEVVE